jgi:hypothetical protein
MNIQSQKDIKIMDTCPGTGVPRIVYSSSDALQHLRA